MSRSQSYSGKEKPLLLQSQLCLRFLYLLFWRISVKTGTVRHEEHAGFQHSSNHLQGDPESVCLVFFKYLPFSRSVWFHLCSRILNFWTHSSRCLPLPKPMMYLDMTHERWSSFSVSQITASIHHSYYKLNNQINAVVAVCPNHTSQTEMRKNYI